MKQIPFDLQRALAGGKVVTRDGREVTQLTKFEARSSHPLVGVADGLIQTWTLNGCRSLAVIQNNLDLFMVPKTVKRWVNFYNPQESYHYDSEAKARRCATNGAIAIAVPVEFEEGYGCDE